jgi:hypothetical protein
MLLSPRLEQIGDVVIEIRHVCLFCRRRPAIEAHNAVHLAPPPRPGAERLHLIARRAPQPRPDLGHFNLCPAITAPANDHHNVENVGTWNFRRNSVEI